MSDRIPSLYPWGGRSPMVTEGWVLRVRGPRGREAAHAGRWWSVVTRGAAGPVK